MTTPPTSVSSETSLVGSAQDMTDPLDLHPNDLIAPRPLNPADDSRALTNASGYSVATTAAPAMNEQPQAAALPQPASTPQHHLRRYTGVLGWFERAALHCIPSYYAITMGTGIASILTHNFPYNARWLEYIGTIIFVLNVACFVVISIFTIARYLCWTGIFRVVLKHNVSSMFWGCFPMGATTIINMICFVCVPVWGRPWAYLAYGLWWADVLVSILVNFGMLFVLFTRQQQTEKSLAPTWLLPIVTSVVAAASGAVVAQALMPYNAALARSTVLVSFCVWGTGVPVAMMIITLVIYRMAIHGPPEGAALASVFLPLGPCGQGSFGIIEMGHTARRLAYEYNMPMVPGLGHDEMLRLADAIYAGGLVVGMILWGLALVWYTLAILLFLDHWRTDWSLLGMGKFAVGLWGLTFPIGVFATSTISLARELSSPAFKVIAAFLSAQVVLHWLFVGIGTLWKAVDGTLFAAPELAGVDENKAVRRRRSPSPNNVRMRFSTDKAMQDVEASAGR